jgi:hypothetical protein
MREIEIAQFGPDVPDGTDVEEFCKQAWDKEFRAELVEDAMRLKELRKQACHPDCGCKQCKADNLRVRRRITKKWNVPR